MKMVFFIGHAGSGKTTISSLVSKKRSLTYLDKDVIGFHYMNKISSILNLDPNDRDSDIYTNEFRDMEYAAMFEIAAQNLLLENDVFLVAPFSKEIKDPTWLTKFFSKYNIDSSFVDVYVVLVHIDNFTIQKNRIFERNEPRDSWKKANWDEYKNTLLTDFEVSWNLPIQNIILFDNNGNIDDEKINELYSKLFLN